MQPIIEDLQPVYNGYKMELNGVEKIIYGKVMMCNGDTLGQHYWGRFKEGVGAAFKKFRHCQCAFNQIGKLTSRKNCSARGQNKVTACNAMRLNRFHQRTLEMISKQPMGLTEEVHYGRFPHLMSLSNKTSCILCMKELSNMKFG